MNATKKEAPPPPPNTPPAAAPYRFEQATAQYKADESGMTVVFDGPDIFGEIDLAGPTSQIAKAARHANAVRIVRTVPMKDGKLDASSLDEVSQMTLLEDDAVDRYARRTRAWRGPFFTRENGEPVACDYEGAKLLYHADSRFIAKMKEADRERNATFRRDRADAGRVREVVRGDEPAVRSEGQGGAAVETPRLDGEQPKRKNRGARARTPHAATGS